MAVDKPERIGVILGQLSADDEALFSMLANRLGSRALFVSHEEFIKRFQLDRPSTNAPERPDQPKTFSELRSRYDFIVKENFHEFRTMHTPDTSKRVVSRAFHALVDPHARLGYLRTDPEPLEGLQVATRQELNLPPWPVRPVPTYRTPEALQSNLAIQVGSLVDAETAIQNTAEWQSMHKVREFTLGIISQLALQVVL